MKKTVLFTACLFTVLVAPAQSGAPGSGFTNSFTIILTEGFQQPAGIGTGTSPVNETINVSAFPNPTNGPFVLEYDLDNEAEVFVEVFDLLGQVVYSETSARNPGHQLHPVNLGDQANGVYFIRCTIRSPSGTTTLTSKVTLSR